MRFGGAHPVAYHMYLDEANLHKSVEISRQCTTRGGQWGGGGDPGELAHLGGFSQPQHEPREIERIIRQSCSCRLAGIHINPMHSEFARRFFLGGRTEAIEPMEKAYVL